MRPTWSGSAMAKAPARKAPDDSPMKLQRDCPVSRAIDRHRRPQILHAAGDVGVAVRAGGFAIAFVVHRPDVEPIAGEHVHRRVFADVRAPRDRSWSAPTLDEPCTRNSTGRAGSPGRGAPTRLRYIASAILLPVAGLFGLYSWLHSASAAAPARRYRRGEAGNGGADRGMARQLQAGVGARGHGFLPDVTISVARTIAAGHWPRR